jgi:hypothetical protein
MHTPNSVLHGRYKYLVENKELAYPMSMTLFLLRKTREGIDYRWSHKQANVSALANFQYFSAFHSSPDFVAWHAHDPVDLHIFDEFLRFYSTMVHEAEKADYQRWQSMY